MIKRRGKLASFTQPQRTWLPSFGKIVAFGLCLTALAPASAAVQPRPFETQLRRSILIKGQEQATYTLAERMKHYRVPGISVAVVDACRIVDARGFGTSAGSNTLVGSHTLFQAGSISKVVTAVAALRLVEEGKLSLDGDIRPLLKDWTLTTAEGIPPAPVTLRQLLGHTAGLNGIGGKGYRRGAPLPTLTQILDGSAPANTPAIRVQATPGKWVYSSGGYYIIQALMAEAAREQFRVQSSGSCSSPPACSKALSRSLSTVACIAWPHPPLVRTAHRYTEGGSSTPSSLVAASGLLRAILHGLR